MSTTQRRNGRRWLVLSACTAMAATLMTTSLSQPAYGTGPGDAASVNGATSASSDVMRPQFADIIEAARPSVVTIAIEKSMDGRHRLTFPRAQQPGLDEFMHRFFGPQFKMPQADPRVRGLGSGFVIDADGYIVTNNHVVEGADRIIVTLHDGSEHEADVLGTDPKTDLALLKISADGLSEARFGDSDRARVGDWVVAIGNPFGLGGTATVGIISARGRDIRSGPYDDFLQIDAPINEGNSGGPVFNTRGEVIGVNTAIFSPNGGNVGIGFAIPSRQAERIVSELRANGVVDRGWLGVQLQAMDGALARSFGLDSSDGALVADVVSGSPAEQAGIKVGDIILEFDGQPVASAKDLSHLVGVANSADRVTVKVWRERKLETRHVTLGRVGGPVPLGHSDASSDEIGLTLAPLDEATRARLGLDDDLQGAVVARIQPGSEAAKQGMRAGDVVLSIDRHEIDSPHDLKRAIERARREGRESIALLLRRGDGQRFLVLSIG